MSSCSSQSLREYVECRNKSTVETEATTTPMTLSLLLSLPREQQLAFLSCIVVLLYPTLYLLNTWKRKLGITESIIRSLRCISYGFLGAFIIFNFEWTYIKTHVDHSGHPPLHGLTPYISDAMYYWTLCGVLDLVYVWLPWRNTCKEQVLLAHCNVIERCITTVIWANPTCLSRIVLDIISTLFSLVVFIDAQSYTRKVIQFFVRSILNTLFIAVQMLYYIIVRGNGSIDPTHLAGTSAWFQVPNTYLHFAYWQLFVVIAQWIIYLYGIINETKATTITPTDTVKQD